MRIDIFNRYTRAIRVLLRLVHTHRINGYIAIGAHQHEIGPSFQKIALAQHIIAVSGSEVLHLIDLLDGFVGPIDHRVHTRPYYVTMVVRTLKVTVTELVELPSSTRHIVAIVVERTGHIPVTEHGGVQRFVHTGRPHIGSVIGIGHIVRER